MKKKLTPVELDVLYTTEFSQLSEDQLLVNGVSEAFIAIINADGAKAMYQKHPKLTDFSVVTFRKTYLIPEAEKPLEYLSVEMARNRYADYFRQQDRWETLQRFEYEGSPSND
jgi:hypothetical protein